MINSIVFLIFLAGLIGSCVIIFRKIPLLSVYSVSENKNQFFQNLKYKIRAKMGESAFTRNFSSNNLLLKILSKSRVLVLKTEHKIGLLLAQLRKESMQSNLVKKDFNNTYWDKIKTIKAKRTKKPKSALKNVKI